MVEEILFGPHLRGEDNVLCEGSNVFEEVVNVLNGVDNTLGVVNKAPLIFNISKKVYIAPHKASNINAKEDNTPHKEYNISP